jgi:putative hemolysin
MRLFIALSLLLISFSSYSNCEKKVPVIATRAMDLFVPNPGEVYCEAIGGIDEIIELETPQVLPATYAYLITFYYPCGPHPEKPEVLLRLNNSCDIISVDVIGFK